MRYHWEEKGSKTLTEVAKIKAKEILANYQPKPLPDSVKDEIDDIFVRAKNELLLD